MIVALRPRTGNGRLMDWKQSGSPRVSPRFEVAVPGDTRTFPPPMEQE